MAVKIATDPSFDRETVHTHLSSVVEGKMTDFSDKELGSITDLNRVRKIYKLGSNNAKPLKGPKSAQTNGHMDDGLHEMEVSILGMMALKGAT